jgi:hypothetical protein
LGKKLNFLRKNMLVTLISSSEGKTLEKKQSCNRKSDFFPENSDFYAKKSDFWGKKSDFWGKKSDFWGKKYVYYLITFKRGEDTSIV